MYFYILFFWQNAFIICTEKYYFSVPPSLIRFTIFYSLTKFANMVNEIFYKLVELLF